MATKTETIVDPSAVAKLLPKKDSVVGKVKLKKPPAAKAKAEPEGPPSPKSPLLNNIDTQLRATFESGRPLDDIPALIQCKHCKKPMLQSIAYSHIKMCLQKKNERAQKKKEQKEANRKAREAREKAEKAANDAQDNDSDEDSNAGDKGAKKAVKSATGKKRKADTEAEKNPMKKKTKKEIEAAKPKVPKPKGPVDVEKQCGVLLPNGAMCARSLTCKSHAMGAKRAVPGRSQPYDYLLAAYQKKNQAKQQKAAMDANAPLIDDIAENQGPVDSDEEKDQVMAAIARSRPQPLAQHVHLPLRQQYQRLRIKDMLSNALGNRGSMMSSSSAAASAAAAGDSADAESRRGSMVQPGSARGPGPGGLPTPTNSRKPSIPATTATAVAT